MYSSKPIRSVHMLCQSHLSLDESVRAGKYRHIFSSDVVKNIKSILSCIGQVSVTGWGGDTKQINFWGMSSVNDSEGVIQTGITVQPDSYLLLWLHFWILFLNLWKIIKYVAFMLNYHTINIILSWWPIILRKNKMVLSGNEKLNKYQCLLIIDT